MAITITRRDDRSAYMFVLQKVVKIFAPQLIKVRRVHPAGSPRLKVPKKTRKFCDVQEREVEGLYVYDVTAKQPSRSSSEEAVMEKERRRIYYFAGGGWQLAASSEHWALVAEFARKLPNTVVSLVSYPLAPSSPAPSSFPQLMKFYHQALADAETANERVILAGDSAGGNLILCMALHALIQDESAPCPAALLAISPSTDLRRHNPDIKVLARHDPILNIPFINWTAKTWRAEWDAADPRVTPLMADVEPLQRRGVKVHGVVGRYDILSPDAVLFREKCNIAGVHGEWLDWAKQMHCFPLTWAFGLPEGKVAKDWMLDVLKRN